MMVPCLMKKCGQKSKYFSSVIILSLSKKAHERGVLSTNSCIIYPCVLCFLRKCCHSCSFVSLPIRTPCPSLKWLGFATQRFFVENWAIFSSESTKLLGMSRCLICERSDLYPSVLRSKVLIYWTRAPERSVI